MHEAEPKPLEQDIATYENQVKKSYSEFGEEQLDVKHWGIVSSPLLMKDINLYTNIDFINSLFVQHILISLSQRSSDEKILLADLGGDDGFLLDKITKGIKQEIPNINLGGFVVDIDSTNKAGQKFKRQQQAGEREQLEFVKSDITKLPFADKSIDILISRMAMQYLNPEQQIKFFFEIDRVLKDQGILQIMTVEDVSDNHIYNEIMKEITSIISGSSNFNRSFPNFEKFLSMEDELEKSGSSLHLVFKTDAIDMPLSVEGFADRFELSDEQKQQLTALYIKKSKQYPNMFKIIDNIICLNTTVVFLQYEK
jgi:ubiquinone/menaquinone biosynthesis C-methylase UbiE